MNRTNYLQWNVMQLISKRILWKSRNWIIKLANIIENGWRNNFQHINLILIYSDVSSNLISFLFFSVSIFVLFLKFLRFVRTSVFCLSYSRNIIKSSNIFDTFFCVLQNNNIRVEKLPVGYDLRVTQGRGKA